MSKRSRKFCSWECCPSGFIEHVKHYRYLREFTDITFFEYWWHETKSLFGGNKPSKEDLELLKEIEEEEQSNE